MDSSSQANIGREAEEKGLRGADENQDRGGSYLHFLTKSFFSSLLSGPFIFTTPVPRELGHCVKYLLI